MAYSNKVQPKIIVYIKVLSSVFLYGIDGGCSSVGRVQDCDSCCRGFEPHQPPQVLIWHFSIAGLMRYPVTVEITDSNSVSVAKF